MMNPSLRTRSPLVAATLALVTVASGCIVHHEAGAAAPPLDGHISFAWSFAGETDCDAAGVAEVDVQVLNNGDAVLFETVDCRGGGLTLTDFYPDMYEVLLDAYSRSGRLLYQGEDVVLVQSGRESDLGLVELRALEAPPPAEGSLSLYWGFRYPTDDSLLFSCLVAGVDVIDVELRADDGELVFADSFACEEDGVIFDALPAGHYAVVLEAWGRYEGTDLLLYDGHFGVEVMSDLLVDAGDLPLDRIYESFADIDVSWEFAGGSCAQLDVYDVTLIITRLDGTVEDDLVTVDCDRAYAFRETFVPGAYLVEVLGYGAYGDYYGSVTRQLEPNSVTTSHVQLVMAP